MKAPTTLQQAVIYFADAENCRKFLIAMRWPDGIVRCPRCGSANVSYLEKARVYFCPVKHEKQKFSLKVGTVMEDSAIAVEKWLPVFWMLANCKNGISSYEIGRSIGVTQKSAWFMLQRIRLAMKSKSTLKIEGGPVEIDETWIGGKAKNMHAKRRGRIRDGWEKDNKTIVMGMLDRETRQVRAKVIPDVTRLTLQNEIMKQVTHGGKVYTDSAQGYIGMRMQNFVHETVNHIEEYVRGEVHTNGIENFWSLLKRSLNGTYVAVEPFHLDRYIDEQAFRFNNRATKDNPLTDQDRFVLAVSQIVGKRLTYAELTGKVGETTV